MDTRGRDVAKRKTSKDQAGVRPENISLVDQRTGRVVKVHRPNHLDDPHVHHSHLMSVLVSALPFSYRYSYHITNRPLDSSLWSERSRLLPILKSMKWSLLLRPNPRKVMSRNGQVKIEDCSLSTSKSTELGIGLLLRVSYRARPLSR